MLNLCNGMIFFQGLAITFVSDENDAKILNEVQDRFDVNITELPDEIDLSSYSEFPSEGANIIKVYI